MGRIIFLAIILLASCCQAVGLYPMHMAASVAAGGGGTTYLLDLDYEETGTPSGVTTLAGTVNYDYATTPAPLVGSQSALMSGSLGAVNFESDFTQTGEIWAATIANFADATPPLNTYFLYIRDSSDNDIVRVQARSGGQFRLYVGGSAMYTSTFVASDNTDVYIKVRVKYVDGLGNDEVEFWINGTGAWGTSQYSGTGLSLLGTPSNLMLSYNSVDVIVDETRVDDANIANY